MNQKPKISVILPTYNERENIEELILRIINTLDKKYSFEIIIVDDNSPDKTWELAQNIKKKNNSVKVIRRLKNKSLPKAIATGIRASHGNVIVWMDCDLSMPPEVIPKLINSLENSDVAIGSRYVKGGRDLRSFNRAVTSFAFNFFTSLILGFGVRDCDSGFVAVKRKVFKKIKLTKEGYGEYFIEFVYNCHKDKFKIKEVPYSFINRVRGKSKTNPNFFYLFYHGLRYLWRVLRFRFA